MVCGRLFCDIRIIEGVLQHDQDGNQERNDDEQEQRRNQHERAPDFAAFRLAQLGFQRRAVRSPHYVVSHRQCPITGKESGRKLPSAPDVLLREPGVEALFQLIAVVSPELWVHVEGRLEVVWCRWQVWQGCRIDVWNGVLVGWAISDILGLLSHEEQVATQMQRSDKLLPSLACPW